MQTLDIYEEGTTKPRFRVRVAKDFTLRPVDWTLGWLVVATEDGGEVAFPLDRTTRLVLRERSEHDERAYEEQQQRRAPAE